MHDVLDIIRNVQTLYAVGPTLGILKDFERVVDELDVYVFTNWEDGELLSGRVHSCGQQTRCLTQLAERD